MTNQTQDGSGEDAMPPEERPVYESNPKHKEPWQRGARGSLCPKDADGPALLAKSQVDPSTQVRDTPLTVIAHTVARNIILGDGMGIRSRGGRSRLLSAPPW
jgi:hypothetical protein